LAACAAVAAAAPTLHASITFLNTQWVSGSEQYDLEFHNQLTSATFDTVTGGTAVYATLESGEISGALMPELQGPLAAHIFVTASTTTPATSTPIPPLGSYLSQPMGPGTISVLLDNAVDGKTNLLTVQFNASILGMAGASTPLFWGQDGLPGQSVTFTSDFLDFSSTSGSAFSWAMSNATPALQLGDGNFLADFAGNGLASFSTTVGSPIVMSPEPASLGLLLLGGVACAALTRRRTR
jgi:hypothetical protein